MEAVTELLTGGAKPGSHKFYERIRVIRVVGGPLIRFNFDDRRTDLWLRSKRSCRHTKQQLHRGVQLDHDGQQAHPASFGGHGIRDLSLDHHHHSAGPGTSCEEASDDWRRDIVRKVGDELEGTIEVFSGVIFQRIPDYGRERGRVWEFGLEGRSEVGVDLDADNTRCLLNQEPGERTPTWTNLEHLVAGMERRSSDNSAGGVAVDQKILAKATSARR